MTFLQPFILWALPLVLIPVIIHLINRLRHRPQPWAAMRFLIEATQSSTSQAKLRQFLILLFRVMAVLALLLFLARPLAGGWMGWMLSPAPDVVLILLDRSASMETQINGTQTKREQALKLMAQAADEFEGASRLVLIDSALRTPQDVINAAGLAGLAAAGPTETAADIPALLQAAFNYLVENRAGAAEIWLASDLQRSNWQPDDPRLKNVIAQLGSLPQKVRIRLLALNQPPERNASLSILEAVRHQKNGQGELQFVLDLQRNTDTAERFPVKTVLDDAESAVEQSMDGQAMRWRYKMNLGDKKTAGWGGFQLPADANTADNTAWFVYGADTPLRAAVIAEDGASGKVLRLAAAAVARNKDAVRLMLPGEAARASFDEDSLIVWQGVMPDEAVGERFRAFAEQGGMVLLFPPGGNAASPSLGALSWGEMQNADAEKPFRIVKWDQEQGPLAKTDEGFSLPLLQTEFKRRAPLHGPKTVLAAFDDGVPFLARQSLGRGQIYFCATLPVDEWSSLGDGPVLVPMLQRLMLAGSRRLQQSVMVNCGDLSPADQRRTWSCVDSTAGKNIRVHAGVYRSGDRWLAVNRPPTEDEPEVLDMDEAGKLFAGVSFQMLQDKQRQTDALQGEIWRFFLFAMLLFLIGESWLILPGKVQGDGKRVAPSLAEKMEAEG